MRRALLVYSMYAGSHIFKGMSTSLSLAPEPAPELLLSIGRCRAHGGLEAAQAELGTLGQAGAAPLAQEYQEYPIPQALSSVPQSPSLGRESWDGKEQAGCGSSVLLQQQERQG